MMSLLARLDCGIRQGDSYGATRRLAMRGGSCEFWVNWSDPQKGTLAFAGYS
jgi:hypothetical protein